MSHSLLPPSHLPNQEAARLPNAPIHQMEVKLAPFAISSWEGGREGGGREGGRMAECAHEGISANVDELQRLPAAPHCAALHCWSSEHGRILSHMRQNIALPDRRVLIPDPPVQPTNDDDDAAQICRRSAALKLDIARPPSERTTERTSFPSL